MEILNIPKNSLLLVIEQEALIQMYLKQTLREMGFRVKGFTDFRIALKVFKDEFRDIGAVFLDLKLFDADYSRTIPALVEVNHKVKIIAISTATADDLPEYFGQKISVFLHKPFNEQEISEALKQVEIEIP